MKDIFRFIKTERRAFISVIDALSAEQLNTIPKGYSNNIIWNFAHIVISTQALCYLRTQVIKDESLVKYLDQYKNGSKPQAFVNQDQIDEFKALAISTIDQIEQDYESGMFSHIEPFSTMTFKEELKKIEDVILTTVAHDGLHFGYSKALVKLVQ